MNPQYRYLSSTLSTRFFLAKGSIIEGVVPYLAVLGFGIVFLWISAPLRLAALAGIGNVEAALALYAPWSYVGGVVLLLFALIVSFNRGARAR